MTTIVGIRFRKSGKILYFDPQDVYPLYGDFVVVETARGLEVGVVALERREVKDEEIVHPLAPVIRVATPEDVTMHEENLAKADEAKQIFLEKIRDLQLDMKLVEVEYTFDRAKLIFSFTSDGRVDFRELVKELAFIFKTRIELRQIGVRDESKVVGGLAPCGREICCKSWLGDFMPVSVKMAKDQNLSLNPVKISGLCGRLMCCLKYEHDTYVQIRVGMPNRGDKVSTPDGLAFVQDTNILKEEIRVRHIINDSNELSEDIITYKKEEITVVEVNSRGED